MTDIQIAVQTATNLLGEDGMEALRSDLERQVRNAIDDAARRAPGPLAEAWRATPCNIKDVAVQDILGEVAF